MPYKGHRLQDRAIAPGNRNSVPDNIFEGAMEHQNRPFSLVGSRWWGGEDGKNPEALEDVTSEVKGMVTEYLY